MKFSFVPQTSFRFFFQDFNMNFINKSYALYTKDTHQI